MWPSDNIKNEKTLTVHDGGVIVLSKINSDLLDASNENNNNRDFVVMVELKYKEPDSTNDNRSVLDKTESHIDTYTIQDKFQSLVTYTEEECVVNTNDAEKTKDCGGNTFIQSEITGCSEISGGQIMLFEPDSLRDSSKEKCLRLITDSSSSSPLKKTANDRANQNSKKRSAFLIWFFPYYGF